ncbi:MAG TPA: bifunctional 2-polyprenyl-6-hydroxyphenol methylase/3-demethylubiquinol 3-O-methyltransferase UbiG [Hanamia sp.]|jgi:2-polyprenyl-6-hydroxyphenyl methylase/3-demethylubiquinone-9 3-methyltransferase|nr:bifunctional 2-polyprenyl-6-hydroxyphenol methylase/3-demethylubiquinol 3-O-methyltransferase UbiG [Hanamia sp.]
MKQAVSQKVYKQIDNDIYDYGADQWWKGNNIFHLLKASINPCRFPYFLNTYTQLLGRNPEGKKAIEVGCGGGILAEEIASAGFDLTGIDPAAKSLETARQHAKVYNLNIHYQQGSGESIPFPDKHFDVLFCCDVLEHVQDLPKCISEFSRVLKPGGVFFFDTFNRNFLSKLVVIKLWQEWKSTAIMPSRLHVYEMFIKPKELKSLMEQNGFDSIQFKGMSPNISPLRMISLLKKRAKGKMTYEELGDQVKLKESNDTKVGYMGFGIKI